MTMTSNTFDTIEFGVLIAHEAPSVKGHILASILANIIKKAKSHGHLALVDCNYGRTHRQETRFENLQAEITSLVEELGVGFGVKFGGDPRGCTVKITVPSGTCTDFGGEGICVPGA